MNPGEYPNGNGSGNGWDYWSRVNQGDSMGRPGRGSMDGVDETYDSGPRRAHRNDSGSGFRRDGSRANIPPRTSSISPTSGGGPRSRSSPYFRSPSRPGSSGMRQFTRGPSQRYTETDQGDTFDVPESSRSSPPVPSGSGFPSRTHQSGNRSSRREHGNQANRTEFRGDYRSGSGASGSTVRQRGDLSHSHTTGNPSQQYYQSHPRLQTSFHSTNQQNRGQAAMRGGASGSTEAHADVSSGWQDRDSQEEDYNNQDPRMPPPGLLQAFSRAQAARVTSQRRQHPQPSLPAQSSQGGFTVTLNASVSGLSMSATVPSTMTPPSGPGTWEVYAVERNPSPHGYQHPGSEPQ